MSEPTKKWKDDKVDVSRLKLDLQNPRLPKYVKDVQDENKTRDHLLRKEHVTRIAQSIAQNGYHYSAVSIAYEDKDGYLIVLDGNRRLAACQLLVNPALAADAKTQKEYERLSAGLPHGALSSIKVAIAPSRKAAEKEIWDIHVSPTAKPWLVLQKLRMYRNLIETGDYDVATASQEYGLTEHSFKKELATLYLYERIDEKTDDKGQEELLKSGFNKIERILLSNNGKKLLDFTVENDGKVTVKNAERFDENITKLTPFVVEPNRVAAQATQGDIMEIVYSQVDPVLFPDSKKSKAPIAPAPIPAPNEQPAGGKKEEIAGTLSKVDWVTDAEYRQYAGADRVKSILEELKKNKPAKGQNLNVVSIALRVVIELAVYDVLKQKGHIQTIIDGERAEIKKQNAARAKKSAPLLPPLQKNWTPTLAQMFDFMLVEANRVILDPQERKALTRLIQTKAAYMTDLNSFMHNVSYKPTEQDTKDIWDTFGRQVFDIIKKI